MSRTQDIWVRSDRDLRSRFLNLARLLNEEMGFRDQRLQFQRLDSRQGDVTWRLDNKFGSANDRTVCALATANGGDADIRLAYNEQWVSAGQRAGLRFKSSNLRFVVEGIDAVAPLQFRLEWVGRDGPEGAFPGSEAAHPHWQFDADSNWTQIQDPKAMVEVEIGEPEEEIDLAGGEAPELPLAPAAARKQLQWFHRLHLPARAMWHEKLRSIPGEPEGQQHEPQNSDEIDYWVLSAVRYVRHEFQTYA